MAVREVKGGILKPTGSDGIMLDSDGPMMSGTWYNPNTGHKFTVRDCFFQDGDFMVQTTSGQILNYNTIQNYVKWEGQDVPDKPMDTTPTKTELPPEVSAELADDYLIPEDRLPLGNINTSYKPASTLTEDPDITMIKRVLGRHSIPECNAEIVWNKAPLKQLETLIDVLGVDIEKITEYYIGLLNKDAVFEYIKTSLGAFIKQLVYTEPEAVPEIKKSPAKKTKKTSKK